MWNCVSDAVAEIRLTLKLSLNEFLEAVSKDNKRGYKDDEEGT